MRTIPYTYKTKIEIGTSGVIGKYGDFAGREGFGANRRKEGNFRHVRSGHDTFQSQY